MFGDVKNCNGDVPIINVDDIHCETIKNVNKEHIGAFYKTANRKFAIILKEVELKDLYSYEINFKGKVGYTEHIYRTSHYLLLEEMNMGEQISQTLFS